LTFRLHLPHLIFFIYIIRVANRDVILGSKDSELEKT